MDNPMVRVARLDHDQVYFGLQEKPAAEVTAGELVFGPPEAAASLPEGALYVDRDCDLVPGAYRWNAERRRFEPLPRHLRRAAQSAVPLERAFYEQLKLAHQADPARVAPEALEWAIGYEKTVDAIVSPMDEAARSLNYFHAASGRKRK